MANKRTHLGIIRPTVPNPQIFWGSPQEIADHLGISYRAVYLLVQGKTKSTKRGHRMMTEEESAKYYEPPKPRQLTSRKSEYNSKKNWLITFVRDGKKSGKVETTDPDNFFSGNPQDFVSFTGCNAGQVYRLINTHFGDVEKYPLKTIKGWRINRVRKYNQTPTLGQPRRIKGEKL